MELFQLRRQHLTRTAVRIGEDQQDAASAQVLQRQVALAVEPRKAKVGRRRAGFQAVTFDLAPGQGTISETSGTFFLAPLWTTLARRMGEGLGVRAAICQGEQRVCTHDQAAGY